jgi:hypothetical protein
MPREETKLEMSERHVREGEAHVRRQSEIIAELREAGHSTQDSEALLNVFEQLLASHRKHLDIVRSEQDSGF